jgi:hypothetical protein
LRMLRERGGGYFGSSGFPPVIPPLSFRNIFDVRYEYNSLKKGNFFASSRTSSIHISLIKVYVPGLPKAFFKSVSVCTPNFISVRQIYSVFPITVYICKWTFLCILTLSPKINSQQAPISQHHTYKYAAFNEDN